MNIMEEINKSEQKEILTFLANRYKYMSQWKFVAEPVFTRYGNQSYQVNRTWKPTEDGIIIYNHFNKEKQC